LKFSRPGRADTAAGGGPAVAAELCLREALRARLADAVPAAAECYADAVLGWARRRLTGDGSPSNPDGFESLPQWLAIPGAPTLAEPGTLFTWLWARRAEHATGLPADPQWAAVAGLCTVHGLSAALALQLAAAGVEDCTALLRLPGTAEGPLAEWVPAAVRFAAEVRGAGPVRLHRTPFLLAAAAAGARAAVAAELSHAYEVVEFARLGCVPARGASRPGLPLLRQR
jgi:hypothetical protein